MARPADPQPSGLARLVDHLAVSRAAIIAARYALPIERAAMVAALALGGAAHG